MTKTIIPIVVAVILAVSFVLVAGILSDTAISIKNKGYVSVKGFAKQEITSDLGILDATIIAEDPDLKKCYTALSEDKNKVMAFLKGTHSVEDEEIELKPVRIKEVYVINERGYNTCLLYTSPSPRDA